ncbi:MAG: transcriptional regulator, partial [Pseudolabrys sp.]
MPQFLFEGYRLDTERRELRRDAERVALEPQVFDLIAYLVKNRDRVLTKDDLFAAVWNGRIMSDSTLTSRINSARKAVGDTGGEQRLIRTYARIGVRFIGEVQETTESPSAEPEAQR